MNQKLLTRIELLFWNFAILVLSHTGRARHILRGAVQLTTYSEWTMLCFWGMLCGLAGLLSGFMLYFLILPTR